jgi:O-methyltransferase
MSTTSTLTDDAGLKSLPKKAFGLLGLKISRIEPEVDPLRQAAGSEHGQRMMDEIRPYRPTADSAIKTLAKKAFGFLGLKISRIDAELNVVEASQLDLQIMSAIQAYTMTAPARVWALLNAIQYISENHIEGDFCECGVWRGGSSMAAALKLKAAGNLRRLWLYDTFSGMSEPSIYDKCRTPAVQVYREWKKHQHGDALNEWCFASLDEVRRNIKSTGYPMDLVRFVVGKVEETLSVPSNIPETIALLRLDTDWYESTKAELEALYEKLSPGGVLILDDYGHWEGVRRAVDEFFASRPHKILLDRIDQGARIAVKIA